jgi:hypothetical protein
LNQTGNMQFFRSLDSRPIWLGVNSMQLRFWEEKDKKCWVLLQCEQKVEAKKFFISISDILSPSSASTWLTWRIACSMTGVPKLTSTTSRQPHQVINFFVKQIRILFWTFKPKLTSTTSRQHHQVIICFVRQIRILF